MLPGKEIFFLFIGSFLLQFTFANTRRMYALCPPDFFGIGTECYYISKSKVNWLDAHFDCKDRKSRLAEPIKYEDRMIRKFLLNNDQERESKWIGGNYNWAKKKWQWQDGKEFTYQSFSQTPGGSQELQYHCAILNPNLNYRWSAISCVDKHQYICQHRMPYVNQKHRTRIYTRWNQTYPNEKANEVEVVLNDADMLKRDHRQSIPITGRTTNVQRLSIHRNFLTSEWLKKYRTSHKIILNRNRIPEGNYAIPQQRNVSVRPKPRRRNPNIGREDFLQFERKINVNRGALITNRVEDDFNAPEPVSTTVSPISSDTTPHIYINQVVDDVTSQPPSSPRLYKKLHKDSDLKEQKRLEETRKMLETGRYEPVFSNKRTTSTTTTSTSTEANVSMADNERIEREKNQDLENRRKQMEEARAVQIQEQQLQNQIDEETLRIEREEEWKKLQLIEDEKHREDERQRIYEQRVRDREEKIRQREAELKEREEEEQRLRDDEERRQEENRKQLEEIERKQQEEQEKQRIDAENKRIEEEKRRRKKDELRQKQEMNKNRISESSEEELNDLRLKEKLRREKLAKLKERIKNLSPEDKMKFLELRGKRNKKEIDGKQNETTTNQ